VRFFHIALDFQRKCACIDGLADKPDVGDAYQIFLFLFHHGGGHEDNRDCIQGEILPQNLGGLGSAHIRQADVHHDEIRPLSSRKRNALLRILRFKHGKACNLKDIGF